MIGTIVWLIGLVCAIWCVLDIFKKNIYYFYGRDHLQEWFK